MRGYLQLWVFYFWGIYATPPTPNSILQVLSPVNRPLLRKSVSGLHKRLRDSRVGSPRRRYSGTPQPHPVHFNARRPEDKKLNLGGRKLQSAANTNVPHKVKYQPVWLTATSAGHSAGGELRRDGQRWGNKAFCDEKSPLVYGHCVSFELSDSYSADFAAVGHLAHLGNLIWRLVRHKSFTLAEL